MSNGKKETVSAETFANGHPNTNTNTRQKAVTSLLNLSSEKHIQDRTERGNTIRDTWGQVCSGWNRIRPTCMYEQKINIKTKNKKVLASFRNISNVIDTRYDRKRIKLLFSSHLKHMFTSGDHEYIHSNGVYRAMKLATSNTDSSTYKKMNIRKPSILLPLQMNSLAKDGLVLPERNKLQSSSSDNDNCTNYCRLGKDLASLRIDGDYPHTIIRRSLKKGLYPKSKSADCSLKTRDQFEGVKETFGSDLSTNENQRQMSNPKVTFTDFSEQKSKQSQTLSMVQLKAMTQQRRLQDGNTQTNAFSRLSCLNLAQPFCNLNTQETFSVLKTKEQKTKKINKGLLLNEICKTFHQEQTYSDYNFGVKSNLDNAVASSTSLGQDLLPEISGKRIQVCSSIHRWL